MVIVSKGQLLGGATIYERRMHNQIASTTLMDIEEGWERVTACLCILGHLYSDIDCCIGGITPPHGLTPPLVRCDRLVCYGTTTSLGILSDIDMVSQAEPDSSSQTFKR
jgi:hypothetical protein